jgi:2-polyprenylphenol 6-hydroxylase
MKHDFDIIIVGGGLVGAACAIALARKGQRVALLDSRPAEDIVSKDIKEDWDNRIYAISPGNAAWLATLGIWNTLDQARICPIENMEVWGDATPEPLQLKAHAANVACLGFIVENRQLQTALWSQLHHAGVDIFAGVTCTALDIDGECASIQLEGDRLTAKLIVAADGGNSWVRAQAHIVLKAHDYEQMAVVANFATELGHYRVARQWFIDDGILAWLPLPGERISMVWSTSNDKARQLLDMEAEALAAEVSAAGKQALGPLKLITPAAAFPLSMQTAQTLVAPRLALVGDAAHQIHPLAGQGVNLGFRDVISLASVLSEKHDYQDIGDLILLRRYERERRADMLAMKHVTHGLKLLFANEHPAVKRLRNWGLQLTESQAMLKKHLIRQAII